MIDVCMTISFHFLNNVAVKIEKNIIDALDIFNQSSNEMKILLKEDAGVAEKRMNTLAKKDRLSSICKTLDIF